MKNRVIAGIAALAVVVALVGLAVVAGRDSDDGPPATLPVLGAGVAAGGATESMASDDAVGMRVAGGVRYEAVGKLPGLADEAQAWTVPFEEVAAGRVAELAEVLGLDGEVRRSETGWTVEDGRKRLDVQDVAGNPWSLYESVPADLEAERRAAEQAEQGAGASGTMPAQDPDAPVASDDPAACAADACDQPMLAPDEPRRPADLPAKDEAERIGRDLLAELGVDLDEANVRVDDGITVWSISADPVIGGLPTVGLTSSVGVGSKGEVKYGNGWLGDLVEGDTYPLIGTAAGLEELSDQQARIMIDPVPCEGCPPVEPIVVRITGVRLGLQLFSTYEKGATGYLVPSYLFSTEDGGEIPVIAVAAEYLGEQVVPTPDEPVGEPEPAPAPDEPNEGEETCTTADGEDASASVCVPVAKAGSPVTFRVVAKGLLRDDCGSPTAEFGDDSDVAVCAIGCDAYPTEPTELERAFEHTYAEPGTYTARIHFHGCGEQMSEDVLTVEVPVRVEG